VQIQSLVWEVEGWKRRGRECFRDKIFGLSGLQLAEAATKIPSNSGAAPFF